MLLKWNDAKRIIMNSHIMHSDSEKLVEFQPILGGKADLYGYLLLVSLEGDVTEEQLKAAKGEKE